MSAPWDDDG
jgi:hypothetical protein